MKKGAREGRESRREERRENDAPEPMDNQLSFDCPLVDSDFHEAFVVPDPIEPLEVLEDPLALVRQPLDVPVGALVLDVLHAVRAEVADGEGEESGWVCRNTNKVRNLSGLKKKDERTRREGKGRNRWTDPAPLHFPNPDPS